MAKVYVARKSDLDSLSSTVDGTSNSVSTLSGTVSSLSTTVSGHTTSINSLSSTVTALSTHVDQVAAEASIFTTQTNSFTLALTHKGQVVPVSSASAVTVTIPTNASVAFPVGSWIEVDRMGTGTVTLAAAGGVTIRNAAAAFTLRVQYSTVMLRKIATNEWIVIGDLG